MSRWAANPLIVVARSALFHIASLLVTVPFLLFLPLLWAPMRVGWPVLRSYIRVQLWLLRVVCGQSYRVEGPRDFAAAPVILAGRHEAMWETLVLPVVFDNPVVFLKREILRYPIAGPIARYLGYIGVDRSGSTDRAREVFQEARARAEEGRSFLIFPNGTRNPEHRLRVQTGVAVLYRALNIPCVPVVVDSGTYWPYKSWLKRPGVITVRTLPMIPSGLKTSALIEQLKEDLARPA